ncbi:Wadjet anti-phage system protein JetD domain-containing protein [Orrella sp. 11846]|uniref:Wadjet anti-phage system protein JetD domain-containing protein n=1 Tax=Orrella sp. 11846 TaxID=3409913 RepID=UPI003B5C936D
MRLPEEVHKLLVRRFQRKHREWLVGDAHDQQWPLEVTLGVPTEQTALKQIDGVRAWVQAWRSWQTSGQSVGTLSWCERRWRTLGVQSLPDKLSLQNAQEVALWAGELTRWERAKSRYQTLVTRWPALERQLAKYFEVLADYDDIDFRRMVDMLDWIFSNPHSNLYPRQIPVVGADSKWLESRKSLISDLIGVLRGDLADDRDFFSRCGLKAQPQLIRLRILDPSLRVRLGGLSDVSAPIDEVARLTIEPQNVFIVENLQTGLAFEDLPNSVVIMRLGYAVDVLGQLPWLQQARCFYWGDMDTHGFAILNRARTYLPNLQSVLMDEATLLSHQSLWVQEKDQHPASELGLLTDAEQRIYASLKTQTYGQQVRLEQERIGWDGAWTVIQTVSAQDADSGE